MSCNSVFGCAGKGLEETDRRRRRTAFAYMLASWNELDGPKSAQQSDSGRVSKQKATEHELSKHCNYGRPA